MLAFYRVIIVLLSLLVFRPHLAQSQSAALIEARKLQSAKKYQEALSILEKEVVSKPEDGNTWFTYAQVQYGIFETASTFALKKEALEKAIQGYENCVAFLDPTTRAYAVAKTELQETHPKFVNQGIQKYQSRLYPEAVALFKYAHIAAPSDTVALIYGVNAANQGQLHADAYYFYEELNTIKPKAPYYQNMFILQKEKFNDNQSALAILSEAQEMFPENYTFQKYEVDMLMGMNRKEEALALLDTLSKSYPKNMTILLNRTLLLDEAFKKQDDADSAAYAKSMNELKLAYQEILALSPKHPMANFNLAALYSQESNTYIKTLNSMSAANFAIYSDSYQMKSREALMEATRYMETAKISQPKNLNILNALKLFYDKLGLKEKSAGIIQEIEALKG